MTTTSRRSFHTFDNDAEAIAYRAEIGSQGAIFVCFDKGEAVLFPDGMPAWKIEHHPMIYGVPGRMLDLVEREREGRA